MPLPFTVDQDPAKVALGERLFHDVRLSHDNSISCATCHQLEQGGDDGLPRSMTVNGTSLSRNAPTVFNVALNSSFNWDGGVPSLEVQAKRVLLNPQVMQNTWPELLGKLRADPDYVVTFDALYPEGLSPASVVDAPFPDTLPTLGKAEAALIAEALRRAEGNQGVAAGMLGLSRQALNKRLSRSN